MTFDPELEAERDGLSHYPVAFLQNLIDNGEGWQAEGALSRAIVNALEDGRCVLGPVAHRDYNNRVVPARRLRAERGEPQLVETEDGRIGVATPA